MAKENNRILVVRTSSDDFKKKEFNFSEQTPVRKVTDELITRLLDETSYLEKHFEKSFQRWPNIPGVAKITLHEKAWAKSRRPKSILNKNSCQIIGSAKHGELLVSVKRQGIEKLKNNIRNCRKTKTGEVGLAAIEKIEPFEGLRIYSNKQKSKSFILKTFDHNDRRSNKLIEDTVVELMRSMNIKAKNYKFGDSLNFFEITIGDDLGKLGDFPGVKTLKPMPQFNPSDFGLKYNTICPIDDDMFPPPKAGKHYPIVGIIDSGTDPKNKHLESWVWGRKDFLDGEEADIGHGSMVAGLIVNGQTLNHKNPLFPPSQAEIVDIVAFPKKGNVTLVRLMEIIEESVLSFPEVKIWNLSLGENNPCEIDEFSELGIFLNTLHDKHQCLFVIASGNYVSVPQRSWPPQDLDGLDRVSAPGDSVRSLTVGSVAHRHHDTTVVESLEPSSFSRRGPAPALTPKPDVNHFGGNCDSKLRFNQVGILSTGPNNQIVENIGTSFATPIVSTLAAGIWHELQLLGNIDPIPERVKALLIHSALLNSNENVYKNMNYFGFGRPSELVDSITSKDNEVSFLFEVDTKEGEEFGRTPFLIPDSLRTSDGKFKGEILMTLVYSPILNPNYPSEYCRSNIDVSFGTYDLNKNNKRSHSGKIPQIKDKSEMFEKALVENGFKWSPVKVFRKSFPRGVSGTDWRLKMDVVRRAEESVLEFPQRATLLITMRSFEEDAKVYQDAVRQVNELKWETQTITKVIRGQVKVRT